MVDDDVVDETAHVSWRHSLEDLQQAQNNRLPVWITPQQRENKKLLTGGCGDLGASEGAAEQQWLVVGSHRFRSGTSDCRKELHHFRQTPHRAVLKENKTIFINFQGLRSTTHLNTCTYFIVDVDFVTIRFLDNFVMIQVCSSVKSLKGCYSLILWHVIPVTIAWHYIRQLDVTSLTPTPHVAWRWRIFRSEQRLNWVASRRCRTFDRLSECSRLRRANMIRKTNYKKNVLLSRCYTYAAFDLYGTQQYFRNKY